MAAVLLLQAHAVEAADSDLPVLTTAEQVRQLSQVEALARYPVVLQGVVIYADALGRTCFVQDATDGIFVRLTAPRTALAAGQRVEVEGMSDPGGRTPFVNEAHVRALGTSDLPPPRPASLEQVVSGIHDARRVQVRGVVRSVEKQAAAVVLTLGDAGKQLHVQVDTNGGTGTASGPLIGAVVRVDGVCGTIVDGNRQLREVRLRVVSMDEVVIEQSPPGEPFALPLSSLAELQIVSAQFPEHRVRVQGTLRTGAAGEWRIEEEGGSWAIQPVAALKMARAGDRAEIVAFAAGSMEVPMLESPLIKIWAPGQRDGDPLELLTRVEQVRNLSAADASLGSPVRVVAWVTYHDPGWNISFIEDETAGIFIHPMENGFKPVAGELYEIEGFSGPGDFAPVILCKTFKRLGSRVLGPARPTTHSALLSGSEDSQRVRLNGVIRFIQREEMHFVITLLTGSGDLILRVPAAGTLSLPKTLVDSEVWVNGVCGSSFNSKRQLSGVHLFLNSLDEIEVVKEGNPDPFAAPLLHIGDIFQFSSRPALHHRVRVQGTVTFRDPQWFTMYVQEGESGLYVRTLSSPGAQVGDVVQIAGFLGGRGERPSMTEAVVRRIDSGEAPPPIDVKPGELFRGEYQNMLIRVQGRVVERPARMGGAGLVLQVGNRTFDALLESTHVAKVLDHVRPGSLVRATGICAFRRSGFGDEVTALWMDVRGPEDIEIISTPPWWNARHAYGVMGAAAAGALFVSAWVMLLRRQVRRQTSVIQAQLDREALARAELRRTQQLVLERERLAAVGQLAAGVAHEFNNIMTVIQMSSEMAIAEQLPGSPAEACLVQMSSASERAAILTRQLLAFSRKQVLQATPVMVPKIVLDLSNVLQKLAGERIALVVECAENVPLISADAGMLSQIIVNLVVNARDAMPDGGRLTLRVTAESIDEPARERHPEAVAGAFVCVTVTDTGCGMEPAVRERVFEPFFTTKEIGKGTGLGLAMSYGIVRQHCGWMEVESEPGSGSTFRLFLPVTEGGTPPVEASPIRRPQPQADETILVVEDESAVRETLGRVLCQLGYTVLSASCARDAIEVWRAHSREIRLVLTDLVMPEISGTELAASLYSEGARVPVIFTSGYATDTIAGAVALDRGTNFLPKPYSIQELSETLRRNLAPVALESGPGPASVRPGRWRG